jgi:hypothetical protein
VCLTGIDHSDVLDTMVVLNLGTERNFSGRWMRVCSTATSARVFARVLGLATRLAAEVVKAGPWAPSSSSATHSMSWNNREVSY